VLLHHLPAADVELHGVRYLDAIHAASIVIDAQRAA
jgi:hypothetical protein